MFLEGTTFLSPPCCRKGTTLSVLLLGFSLRAILIASLHIKRKPSKREASSSEATYLNWIALTARISFHVRRIFNRHEPKS